jgi:flagellar FliL protein
MADEEDKKPEEKEDAPGGNPDGEEKDSALEEGEEGEEGGGKGLSKKKKLILALGVALILVGAALAATLLGGGASEEEMAAEAEAQQAIPQLEYYDLDEFLVNLNTSGKRNSFLKMTVTLELPGPTEKATVETKLPRIRDTFQVYLRELRASDLDGSAGLHRLREELLLRINQIIHPYKVNDILFKEVIVQ